MSSGSTLWERWGQVGRGKSWAVYRKNRALTIPQGGPSGLLSLRQGVRPTHPCICQTLTLDKETLFSWGQFPVSSPWALGQHRPGSMSVLVLRGSGWHIIAFTTRNKSPPFRTTIDKNTRKTMEYLRIFRALEIIGKFMYYYALTLGSESIF